MHEETTTQPQHPSFWSELVPRGVCSQIIQNLRQLLTNRLHTVGHQHEGPLACSCIPQCCICLCTGNNSHHWHRKAAINLNAISCCTPWECDHAEVICRSVVSTIRPTPLMGPTAAPHLSRMSPTTSQEGLLVP